MKKTLLLVAAMLCVELRSTPASAQEFDVFGIDSNSGYNSLLAYSQIKHNSPGALDPLSVRNRYLKRKGAVGTRSSRPTPRGITRFRTDAAARKRTLASLVAKARATNPRAAAALQRDFAKGDPIVAIAPALSHVGLRSDDVADSAAAYLVTAWYGARGSTQDVPPTQLRVVRNQMQRVLLSQPKFASLSNATKQQMSDALLLQTMVTDRLLTSAKTNPSQMASARSSIRQTALKTFKLDLLKIKLTSQGLQG